jgi:hypothetical protein
MVFPFRKDVYLAIGEYRACGNEPFMHFAGVASLPSHTCPPGDRPPAHKVARRFPHRQMSVQTNHRPRMAHTKV